MVRTDAAELHGGPDAARCAGRETSVVRSHEAAGRCISVDAHERHAAADCRLHCRHVRQRVVQSGCVRRITVAGDC